MFPTKCRVQNDRTNREKMSCFCQNLLCTIYFTIKTSIFKLRPLFRFLCPINSFYRRCVSCIHIQYIQHILYNRSNISNRSNWFKQLRKLTPNDVSRYGKLHKLTLNDVNRYSTLRKLTVNYVSRYSKLRKQLVRKRQNSRRGFR